MSEVANKWIELRRILVAEDLGAIRFRGVDFFAWITGGASNVVLLAAETGVADVLISRENAWILTDAIEAPRLVAEEPLDAYELRVAPWQDRASLDAFAADAACGKPIASDRPSRKERALPDAVVRAKRRLCSEERTRYRALGRDAAAAMTETLFAARPDWTEYQLAGAGAEALWRRGIEPTLTLSAGDERLPKFRHPTASSALLGSRAMLVFCGRRNGLFANLTRFVYFREPSGNEKNDLARVARVEAAAWRASSPGSQLQDAYHAVARAYSDEGVAQEIDRHHQGGTTGYLSREVVASPQTAVSIDAGTAFAWNPSIPGTKIEDTVIVDEDGLEILTVDDRWPTFDVQGRARPDYCVRK